jgi:transposase
MDQVHVIRHKVLVEGLGIRRVARDMGVSRNTVRKYLTQSEPIRVEKGPRPRPVLEKAAPRIDGLLEEWSVRTTAKQRITGSRVYRQLVEEGFEIGVTTVRGYLREKRRQAAEVYIPLVHRPGDEAQVDFFEVTVDVNGERRKAWKFVMRMMYSGSDFVWLYDFCDRASFLDGHVRAFAYFGSVPKRIVYDNLSAAVKRIVGIDRELTERFKALQSHYLFEPCFTRRGEGHDKGGVEGRGKGLRLQHFTPIPRGDSLVAISQRVLVDVERAGTAKRDINGKNVPERFREEVSRMLPLPSVPFQACIVECIGVTRQAKIRVAKAVYTVPCHWAQLEATAYVGAYEVRVVCGNEEETYPRQKKGAEHIQYRHYLPELARKPQAVRQVAPELVQELGQPYRHLWSLLEEAHGGKEAGRVLSRVLGAMVEHGQEEVTKALESALEAGRQDLLDLETHIRADDTLLSMSVPEPLTEYQIEPGRATDYDWLLHGGEL